MSTPTEEREPEAAPVSPRHLQFGWWALLVFLAMGLFLELLHGFKLGAYLDVSNHTRREMWTLAHAHGTLFSLVNVAFGLTLRSLSLDHAPWAKTASVTLLGATLCIPAGFFLGGLFFWQGDPGLGILLVPLGGLLLLISVFVTARGVRATIRG